MKQGMLNSRIYINTLTKQGSRAKRGVLIAFGELFLKSEGVRKLFQRRLINNLCFFLEKEKIEFKIHSFRERIFIETNQALKAKKIIKRTFCIDWF